jgi:hypothetical protein
MKKIPLTQAIALLTQALDVAVEEQSQTIVFQLGKEGEPFLCLETEEDFSEFHYIFEAEHNQEVTVEGEWMTLIASPDHLDNPELTPVRMRLLRVMDLEESRDDAAEVERWERIAQDTKKEFVYDKHAGTWYWHDRGDGGVPEATGFATRREALLDAIGPYLEEDEDEEQEAPTYCIKRFYGPELGRPAEVILEGLTLAEAKEHCENPTNEGDGFFDGFEKE